MKIRKFNNRNGAILCTKCNIILAVGYQVSKEDWAKNNNWYCIGCIGENIVGSPVVYENKIIAIEEIDSDEIDSDEKSASTNLDPQNKPKE